MPRSIVVTTLAVVMALGLESEQAIMKRRQKNDPYRLYDETTEPALASITQPIRLSAYQPERPSWLLRAIYALGNFFAAVIRKINQLLAFALSVLLLLLFIRFLLLFFGLTLSDFAHWVFLLSTPLVSPFEHLLPSLPYDGYVIDISTLISIVAYALAVTIVRQFLKLLVTK